MAIKLKQDRLFQLISANKLKVVNYLAIYSLHHGKADEKLISAIPSDYIQNGKLNAKALDLLKAVDKLFLAGSKSKIEDHLGVNYKEKLERYNELFPPGLIPSGSRARAPIPALEKKFLRFFNDYSFSWEIILKATDLYVSEYEDKKYEKMRTSAHFIIKRVDGEDYCDLAEYCEKIKDGVSIEKTETKFKTNVL